MPAPGLCTECMEASVEREKTVQLMKKRGGGGIFVPILPVFTLGGLEAARREEEDSNHLST
jgi:hypothetical protein